MNAEERRQFCGDQGHVPVIARRGWSGPSPTVYCDRCSIELDQDVYR